VGIARAFAGDLETGGERMKNITRESRSDDGIAALGHLERALQLLDQIEAPGEIGALVDHAIQRLRASLIPPEEADCPQSVELRGR